MGVGKRIEELAKRVAVLDGRLGATVNAGALVVMPDRSRGEGFFRGVGNMPLSPEDMEKVRQRAADLGLPVLVFDLPIPESQ